MSTHTEHTSLPEARRVAREYKGDAEVYCSTWPWGETWLCLYSHGYVVTHNRSGWPENPLPPFIVEAY